VSGYAGITIGKLSAMYLSRGFFSMIAFGSLKYSSKLSSCQRSARALSGGPDLCPWRFSP
jgi:hypothetical protein